MASWCANDLLVALLDLCLSLNSKQTDSPHAGNLTCVCNDLELPFSMISTPLQRKK